MLALMQRFLERIDQARFSDPGFSRYEHRLALAALCELPALQQHADFAGSADKFRQRARVRGVEAAFHLSFAADREEGNTGIEAFQLLGTELRDWECRLRSKRVRSRCYRQYRRRPRAPTRCRYAPSIARRPVTER